jgi:hypothetical protein
MKQTPSVDNETAAFGIIPENKRKIFVSVTEKSLFRSENSNFLIFAFAMDIFAHVRDRHNSGLLNQRMVDIYQVV